MCALYDVYMHSHDFNVVISYQAYNNSYGCRIRSLISCIFNIPQQPNFKWKINKIILTLFAPFLLVTTSHYLHGNKIKYVAN